MKIGSVEFYKRLILISLALLILIPASLSVIFGIKSLHLAKQLETMKAQEQRSQTEEYWMASIDQSWYPEINAIAHNVDFTLDYQKLFPDLKIDKEIQFDDDVQDSVYLTFDDGPSTLTPKVLKTLKEKEIKATFFVVYNDSPEAASILRQMIEDGHTIGIHSTTHVYNRIYASVDDFIKDFEITAKWVYEVTGIKPEIFRFPGGSINAYNQQIYQPLIAEMLRRGYVFYDWNVSSGDASKKVTKQAVLENVIQGAMGKDKAIVLMHDSCYKEATLKALPEIIDRLEAVGKVFMPLDRTVQPVTFGYIE